jgi:hypothetical protein
MNNMNTNAEHPIWDVYDEYRTARFNVRYYERQLRSLRWKNLSIEVVIALSVSSGVAGLWLWETAVGGIIWKALVTLAAFIAVVKPLVKFSDQIQQKSETLTSWRLLDDGLRQLIILVRQCRKYDEEMQNRFLTLIQTKSTIVQREPPESVDERLRRRCFEQVNQELPSDKFFVPEE